MFAKQCLVATLKHTHRRTWCLLVVAVLALAGPLATEGRADFVLMGTEHLDVTTPHGIGILHHTSTANVLSGGSIGTASVNDSSSVNISGGHVENLYAYGSSTVNLSGGSGASFLDAYDNSTVDISWGSVVALHTYDSSTMNISGGSVNNFTATDTSAVTISGGILNAIFAEGSSTMNFSGGRVNDYLAACGSNTMNISGGSVNDLFAYDTSTVDISGGSVVNRLRTRAASTVTLHGYDFQTTGGLTLDGDRVIGTGILTGRWFGPDDTMWSMTISENPTTATIQVVPEPATMSLLAFGLGAFFVRRRKRN